jgi:hypothetical protein
VPDAQNRLGSSRISDEVTLGTNILICQDREKLVSDLAKVLQGKGKSGTPPPLRVGHARDRIAEVFCQN